MDVCRNCGGGIMEPGKAYGWAGNACLCPTHPSRLYQNPASRPLDATPTPSPVKSLEERVAELERQVAAIQRLPLGDLMRF